MDQSAHKYHEPILPTSNKGFKPNKPFLNYSYVLSANRYLTSLTHSTISQLGLSFSIFFICLLAQQRQNRMSQQYTGRREKIYATILADDRLVAHCHARLHCNQFYRRVRRVNNKLPNQKVKKSRGEKNPSIFTHVSPVSHRSPFFIVANSICRRVSFGFECV